MTSYILRAIPSHIYPPHQPHPGGDFLEENLKFISEGQTLSAGFNHTGEDFDFFFFFFFGGGGGVGG